MHPPAPAVGLVTYAGQPELAEDDQLLIPALAAYGLRAGPLVWDDPAVDWAALRVCVIRATWDYHHRRAEFAAWVDRAAALTDLWNPAPVLHWNTEKTYLRDLAACGIPIVPTVWLAAGASADLGAIRAAHGWDQVVIKPTVSADSYATGLFTGESLAAGQAHLDRWLPERALMVQPFLPSVLDYGERSLLFVDGVLTHAVRRSPPPWDGQPAPAPATLVDPTPAEAALAHAVLRAVDSPLLYARVDLVRDPAGTVRLLELELTEPSLFLDLAPPAVTALAAALARRVLSAEY